MAHATIRNMRAFAELQRTTTCPGCGHLTSEHRQPKPTVKITYGEDGVTPVDAEWVFPDTETFHCRVEACNCVTTN